MNFMCDINWIELIIGAAIGFIIAVLYDEYKTSYRNKKLKNTYSHMVGNFKSYDDKDNKIEKSIARIVYKEENLLEIEVKYQTGSWQGIIRMDTTLFGTLSFSSNDEKKIDMGIKTIVYNKSHNSITMIPETYYLISEIPQYNKETFYKV